MIEEIKNVEVCPELAERVTAINSWDGMFAECQNFDFPPLEFHPYFKILPDRSGSWFYRNPSDSSGLFTLLVVDDINTACKGVWYGPIDISIKSIGEPFNLSVIAEFSEY